MKILFCIPNLAHGGAERQLSYLAAELANMGHEVHVASRAGGPNLERILSAGVTWHWLKTSERAKRIGLLGVGRLIRAIGIFLKLVRLLRNLKPDLVQTILAPMDLLGGAATLVTRTPWILKEGSSQHFYATYRKYWFRFAFGRLADLVISNSAHAYDYWRPVRNPDALHIIPNGLPIDEMTKTSAAGLRGFNFRPDEKVVLYAGRIDSGKNVEAFIAALARLSDELPFKAIVCGDGPHRLQVERMVRELALTDRVFFTTDLDNVWGLMKCADAFVSLSRFEGCPNVVLEAMACGCPLVLSDIPAHRELLADDAASFVDLEKPEEAAQAIADVLRRGPRCDGAGITRAKAATWTVEANAREFERVYLRLLTGAADTTAIPVLIGTGCARANES